MTINLHQALHFIRHFFVAKRNGHGVHSPFAYQLCEEVFYNQNAFYDFTQLDKVRKALLEQEGQLTVEELGAGSKAFKSTTRNIKELAAKGISSKQQSEMLYRLMNFLNCHNALELGTSLGLTTLYLAKVNKQNNIISIEGSKALYEFATQLAKKNKVDNIHFVNDLFDTALPKILRELPRLDLLYIDGNHTYEATLRYFELALEKQHTDSVFIFDDIYWSKDMTKAWEEIKKHRSVTLSIDTFYSGLVFFKEEIKEKIELRFFV